MLVSCRCTISIQRGENLYEVTNSFHLSKYVKQIQNPGDK